MPAVTAPKAKSSKSKINRRVKVLTYADIRNIADKPISERKEVPFGRHGEMGVPRKFHLNAVEIAALKQDVAENGKGNPNYVPNPQNKGFYHFVIETLKRLGVNHRHSDPVVKAKFREITNTPETKDAAGKTFWSRWKNKDARSDDNALDWEGRFDQNVEVLQRLGGKTPYGLKLHELKRVIGGKGVCIDILKGAQGQKMYMLNTDSAKPVNEFRTRGVNAPSAPKADKPKAARKSTPKVEKSTSKDKSSQAASPDTTPATTTA